ncbi:MAG TPA: glycine--tRNA ligase subunit beta [Candidatus Omnitrophota bacterium]|nr:glycine--tRNA ligase subunit beta [Candidatus Omnitrophota bacterium]HRY85097.1 glycine--tRNA ligase subunit beta [Candidatus Omnitrophota bacterium]
MPNLLIEIGTEELPVGSLDVLYQELEFKTRQKLVDERVAFSEVRTEATPRRIALFVQGIATMQPDRTLEIPGPLQEKCYDAQGKPTQTLQGFLKSKQAAAKDIEIRETPKGKFIFLKKKEKGKPVAALLPDLIKDILASLSFPKLMRWESSGFRFPRPIRWVVALMDVKKVPLALAGVKSGNKSFGHRFLAPQGFSIPRADWKAYIALLKKKHVHLPLEAREAMVRNALRSRFGQKKIDEELVHINAHLVEEPFFLQGTFSQEYLELPAEVLANCMKKNQKVFACYDAKGQLKNGFVAVMNGKRNNLAKIRADYENVLDSRLKDARYFYEMDTRESFEKKKPVLGQLVYLGKLGSMLDKTHRLEKMASIFTEAAGRKDLSRDLERVASLSKVDLVTHLVYEMPELQGIVGGEYAREAGEKEEVASAVSVQYLPKNLGEDHHIVKQSMDLLGAFFGIIDRLDLLTGAFGTGIEPTGSQDPFALRRAGGVVVKLVRAFDIPFSLEAVVEANIKLYGDKLTQKNDLKTRLFKFLQERVSFELGVKPGTRPYEILQAVMRSSFDDLADVYRRFEILTAMDEKTLIKAAKVIQRTANMLKGYGKTPGEPKPELLIEWQERKLFELIQDKSQEVAGPISKKEYEKATQFFAEIFAAPLHDFFDHVLVNAEDAGLRENRMAMVARINRLYAGKVADLSLLSRIDEE